MAAMTWGPAPSKGVDFVPPGDREKDKGNALFKEGRFEAALNSYRNGLEAVHFDVTARGVAARLALHLNISGSSTFVLTQTHARYLINKRA